MFNFGPFFHQLPDTTPLLCQNVFTGAIGLIKDKDNYIKITFNYISIPKNIIKRKVREFLDSHHKLGVVMRSL